MKKPKFRTEIVISVYFKRIIKKKSFADVHDLIQYLVDDDKLLNMRLEEVSKECSSWLEKQLDWLKVLELPEDTDAYNQWLTEIISIQGDWIPLDRIPKSNHVKKSYLRQFYDNGYLYKVIVSQAKILYWRIFKSKKNKSSSD